MEVPNITWDDIGGLEDVKRELQELVQVQEASQVTLHGPKGAPGSAGIRIHVDMNDKKGQAIYCNVHLEDMGTKLIRKMISSSAVSPILAASCRVCDVLYQHMV